jgi:pectinesterase
MRLTGDKNDMNRISRRRFVQSTGLLAAAPALTALSVKAQAQQQTQAPGRGQGRAPDTSDLRVDKDIVFGKGGDMDLLLDVYHPPEGVMPKRMAIIHLFGGGFFVGNKNAGYIVNDARALGRLGYTSISANYRLQSQGHWPAQIHDTKAAIRWARANADRIGVDADKIAVAGYSAGGMLSLLAAGTNGMKEFEGDGGNAGVSSDVQAGIGVYPLASAEMAKGLWPEGEATPENMAAASPTTYISKNFAPTIFVHGTDDHTIPVASSINFFTKLHELGVPTTMTLIQGADHAFDNSALDAVDLMANSIDLFLDRLLINPKPYAHFGAGGGGRGRPGGGGRGGPGGAGRGGPGGGRGAPGGGQQ